MHSCAQRRSEWVKRVNWERKWAFFKMQQRQKWRSVISRTRAIGKFLKAHDRTKILLVSSQQASFSLRHPGFLRKRCHLALPHCVRYSWKCRQQVHCISFLLLWNCAETVRGGTNADLLPYFQFTFMQDCLSDATSAVQFRVYAIYARQSAKVEWVLFYLCIAPCHVSIPYMSFLQGSGAGMQWKWGSLVSNVTSSSTHCLNSNEQHGGQYGCRKIAQAFFDLKWGDLVFR